MNRRNYIKTIVLGSVLPLTNSYGFTNKFISNGTSVLFKSNWHLWPNMKWVGPQYWGNRLQDWSLENGQVVCTYKGKNRNLHLLTVQNLNTTGFNLQVTISILDSSIHNLKDSSFGIVVGAKGRYDDYRSSAVFGKGVNIALNLKGNLVIGGKVYKTSLAKLPSTFTLQAIIKNKNDKYQNLTVNIINPSTKSILYTINEVEILGENLKGNFALLSHIVHKKSNNHNPVVGFKDWSINSDTLYTNENNIFGPICFAQYTLHRNKLKITAQLSPVEEIKKHKVLLQFKKGNNWITQQEKKIVNVGRAVNFSIENWDNNTDTLYRIRLQLPLLDESLHLYDYEGTILAEPNAKHELKAAVFSCNFDYGFPDADISKSIKDLDPDICMFLGDQFYEGTGGYGAQYTGDFDKVCLDYLRKWMMFGWSYREIFRHRPCAIIPDDHDVYHGNIWGEEGKLANNSNGYGASSQDSGGYKMSQDWVNMVQFTQTSHLPDPYDATPVKNNIGVYYTHWNYGGISFAILEDRKFKSAPLHVLPKEAKVKNGWIMADNFDIKKYRNLEAELLGKRQESFLENWIEDWSNGAQMKAVLSQTNFATVATLPKGAKTGAVIPSLYIPEKGEYIEGDCATVDMDSNGWPANKRDKAIEIIRKGFVFHIAGDQHLGSFIQYGVEEYGDSGFAFAGPALNNIWPRRFWPPVDSSKHTYNKPAYTGNHLDGFGNKMTVKAVANPHNMHKEPKVLFNRAVGFGVVTFNKKERTIKTDCYRRFVNVKNNDAQYPGWPQTITQQDNYARKPIGYLPNIKVEGMEQPVITIINQETNKIVYTMRLNSNSFTPKIFDKNVTYIIKIGDPDLNKWQILEGVSTSSKQIIIKF